MSHECEKEFWRKERMRIDRSSLSSVEYQRRAMEELSQGATIARSARIDLILSGSILGDSFRSGPQARCGVAKTF